MHRAPVAFRTIVGLDDDSSGAKPSEKAAQTILEILHDLRGRQPAGLLLIHQTHAANLESTIAMVRSAGIDCRPITVFPTVETGGEQKNNLAAERLELIEASDLLLVVRRSQESEPAAEEIDTLEYAKSIGRPIIVGLKFRRDATTS
jgi:hypothetical protein